MFVSGTRAAASRPAITASSSSTGTRWARTGRCLKKDPASQAEAAAADAFPCRSATHSRRGPQSDTPRLFQPDLRLRPADQEAAALPVTAIDKTSGVLRVVGKGNKERVV